MNRMTLSVFVLAAAAVAWPRLPAAADEPALKLGQEAPPAGEAKVIEELVAFQVALMKKADATKRGQHPKPHGCVAATVAVRDDVPKEYRYGLFARPGTYQARIRYSNGTVKDDKENDSHGMAVRVLGVKGPRAVPGDGREEQHFILADGEEFFAPDPASVLAFMKAKVEATAKKDKAVFVDFLKARPDLAKGLAGFVKPPPPSVLTVPYFSSVPYKLGGTAVKYTATPAAGNGPGHAGEKTKDYLRAALAERLAPGKSAAVFVLGVVPQTDPKDTPVEDPTKKWPGAPVPVATITIAAQEVGECDESVFDPWVSLAEHRPLGGINRARRAVYAASVGVRGGK
ncbi:MAG TPA: hypothetical protein VD866_08635 [Urbifossiella sp.]|nr:hypothetical protein [Urbifossiella sp.]